MRARYPMQLPARYRSVDREQSFAGVGLTVNISSKSLLLTCQHELKLGTRLEVMIKWPCLLESTIPLQLVATGTVIRCQGLMFALEFAQYEFRTMKTKLSTDLRFSSAAAGSVLVQEL